MTEKTVETERRKPTYEELLERHDADCVLPYVLRGNGLLPEPIPYRVVIPDGLGNMQRVTFQLHPWTKTYSVKMEKAGVPDPPRGPEQELRWARYMIFDSGMIAGYDAFTVPTEDGGVITIDDSPDGREKFLQINYLLLQLLCRRANELMVEAWQAPEEEFEVEGPDPKISGRSSDGATSTGQPKGSKTRKPKSSS
jgi:hypothetical protein